jgi:DNA-binding NtrC family response regulator
VLDVPSLRQRKSDIPALAMHILGRIAAESAEAPRTLSQDALQRLQEHSWPGNVRELENVLRAAVVFAESSTIDEPLISQHLREDISDSCSVDESSSSFPTIPLRTIYDLEFAPSSIAYHFVRNETISLHDIKRRIERDCIKQALLDAGGNITKAATLLGMKRPRLSQLVKEHGLAIEGGRL